MRRTINFQHEAVYYQTDEITDSTKEVWFVLHGYGQLPQYFIRKFNSIQNTDRVIVAPGGLSRFYLEGFSGRVGSTWMTKEERLLDIDNYIRYLNKVAEEALGSQSEKVKITLLGFSQGSATVCRWAQQMHYDFEKLILHSGAFPSDIDFSGLGKILSDKEVYMLRGTSDEFNSAEREQEQRALIEKLSIDIKEIEFEGKHDIDERSLLNIIEQ